MWFIIDALADMAAGVEWSSLWNMTLGALLAMWVTHQSSNPAGRQVVIPADSSNGCHTELSVNGHPLEALLDSGATGMPLVLGSNQAAEIGIPVSKLRFNQPYSSANGVGYEALVRLRSVTIAGWTMQGVPAVITEASQDEALLGAVFLHRMNFTTTSDGNCSLSMPVEARMTTARAGAVHHKRPE